MKYTSLCQGEQIYSHVKRTVARFGTVKFAVDKLRMTLFKVINRFKVNRFEVEDEPQYSLIWTR